MSQASAHRDAETRRIATAAARLSVPRAAEADSFVLHASLELLARVGLLAYVDDGDRAVLLDAIDALVERYEAWGPPAPAPSPVRHADARAAAAALDAAIRAGQPDTADAALIWLGADCEQRELRHLLGPAVADALGAAGHTPIGLHLLASVGGPLSPTLLRGAVRDPHARANGASTGCATSDRWPPST